MDDTTSVADFQSYHNPHFYPSQRTSLQSEEAEHLESIEHDLFDNEHSTSGSVHPSSECEEAVFDPPSHHSSPQTSPQHSDDEISVLLSESGYPCGERERAPSFPYTPLKPRSPFRNPSSVCAMQLGTTPPHLASPSSQQRYKLTTPSRNGTPRSVRSHNSAVRSASRLSPTKKVKKEYPLVLLHVTLLPLALSYSTEVLESVLPGYILENWKLLQEKATDTVLERGILIPHPREDYDLLEERLLESLELAMPRILKCGHFHLEVEEEQATDEEEDLFDEDAEDADICDDCGRRVRDGRYGSGTGSKRWDIKLYAANGLMRAGAWGAAWREMERVDVEILPWMEEDMKRELELRKEEEERHIMGQAQIQREEAMRIGGGKSKGLDDERMREIYGEEAQAYVDGLGEKKVPVPSTPKRRRARKQQQDVPLWTLLKNYVWLAVQDRRNVAICILTVLVLGLSLGFFGRAAQHPPLPSFPTMPTAVADARDNVDSMLQSRTSIATAIMPAVSVAESNPVPLHSLSGVQSPSIQPLAESYSASAQFTSGVPPAPSQVPEESFTPEVIDESRFEFE